MSLGGSLSGISFGGLSSGIDTNSIIDKLMQLQALPIQRYQARLSDIQTEQDVLSQFKAKLQSLSTAASMLNSSSGFSLVTGTSSATDVASISAGANAPVGIYSLSVDQLAQSQKISSAAQVATNTALNQTGTFVVNGKTVQIGASDTLATIAQKINGAGAGVTASLIDGGANRAYLTLASTQSGAANRIQLADVSGSVLGTLGVLSGPAVGREAIPNGFTTYAFSASDQSLDQLLPNTGLTTTSFTINGQNVAIDFTTDTLQSLAAKISSLGGGTTASVRTLTDSGGTKTYKLDITNAGGLTFGDPNNVLGALGVVQQGYASELVQAKDAAFTLDGVNLTSATNTITTAIPGVTLTLLRDDSSSPATSTLTLSRDSDGISKKIHDFADAYNATIDFINANSQFDKDTYATGPLFGDPVALQVESAVSSLVSGGGGSSGPYSNLAAIGFGVDDKGKLTVDDSMLTNAINTSPDALAGLFQTAGKVTGTTLNYIYAGTSTKPGSYDVQITSLWATQAYSTLQAQTSPLANDEKLTFSGTLFGTAPVELQLTAGMTLAQVIDAINNDAGLKDAVTASDDGSGHLTLTSKKQGTAGAFSVVSDQPASGAGDQTEIGSGTSSDLNITLPADLTALIDGEPATGSGNILTGNSGNANTAGLQVEFTGNTLGFAGTVTVTKGVGAKVYDMMSLFTDPINGLLASRDAALAAQQQDIEDSITRLQKSLQDKQVELQQKFAAMETAISQIQAQAMRIQSIGSN